MMLLAIDYWLLSGRARRLQACLCATWSVQIDRENYSELKKTKRNWISNYGNSRIRELAPESSTAMQVPLIWLKHHNSLSPLSWICRTNIMIIMSVQIMLWIACPWIAFSRCFENYQVKFKIYRSPVFKFRNTECKNYFRFLKWLIPFFNILIDDINMV